MFANSSVSAFWATVDMAWMGYMAIKSFSFYAESFRSGIASAQALAGTIKSDPTLIIPTAGIVFGMVVTGYTVYLIMKKTNLPDLLWGPAQVIKRQINPIKTALVFLWTIIVAGLFLSFLDSYTEMLSRIISVGLNHALFVPGIIAFFKLAVNAIVVYIAYKKYLIPFFTMTSIVDIYAKLRDIVRFYVSVRKMAVTVYLVAVMTWYTNQKRNLKKNVNSHLLFVAK